MEVNGIRYKILVICLLFWSCFQGQNQSFDQKYKTISLKDYINYVDDGRFFPEGSIPKIMNKAVSIFKSKKIVLAFTMEKKHDKEYHNRTIDINDLDTLFYSSDGPKSNFFIRIKIGGIPTFFGATLNQGNLSIMNNFSFRANDKQIISLFYSKYTLSNNLKLINYISLSNNDFEPKNAIYVERKQPFLVTTFSCDSTNNLREIVLCNQLLPKSIGDDIDGMLRLFSFKETDCPQVEITHDLNLKCGTRDIYYNALRILRSSNNSLTHFM